MKQIRLFCAAGMSTSLLVSKMRKAAEEMGYECEINAYSVSQVSDYGKDADVVLLGPQVRYELKKVQEKLPDKKIEVIDMMDYGMANGSNVLKRAIEIMGEEE